eukprot:257177-Rhodomonas_salina.1
MSRRIAGRGRAVPAANRSSDRTPHAARARLRVGPTARWPPLPQSIFQAIKHTGLGNHGVMLVTGLRFEEELRSVGGEEDTEDDVRRRRRMWEGNQAFLYQMSRGLIEEGLEGVKAKGQDGVSVDRLDDK